MSHRISFGVDHFRRIYALLSTVSVLALSGCASHVTTPRPTFKEIAVIPVTSPTSIYTENRMLAAPLIPAMIASSVANRLKTNEFNERMARARDALGPRFTQMLVEELRAQGFSAHVFDTFTRSSKAPDDINYDKLPTQDAVLHIWFTDVSMDSPRTSSDYVPRVNIEARFYPKRNVPYEHQLYLYYRYGTDANGEKSWSIPSDPKYRYANFDSLMRGADSVAESWEMAMREMARRIAHDLPKAE